MSLHQTALSAQLAELRKAKAMADRAFVQLRDDDFHFKLNPEQSSIAAYIQHMTGNMRSRFTDFLTSDGEKPSRDRETEFAEQRLSRDQLMKLWNDGWQLVFSAIEPLKDPDLERTITIRNEPHSVILAITRQVAHYSYHVGQILLLAKHIKTSRNEPWNYLTIAPGGSRAFNKTKGM